MKPMLMEKEMDSKALKQHEVEVLGGCWSMSVRSLFVGFSKDLYMFCPGCVKSKVGWFDHLKIIKK